MAFILYRDIPDDSIDALLNSHKNYRDYLESVKDRMPQSAYEFATAEWHYNFSDHKALHDGWLEELIIREPASGERNEIRSLEIFVRLLAAYHDGFIELTYKNVRGYSLGKPVDSSLPNHRDWLNDEIRLSENGLVLHEIIWESGEWLIECEDVIYEWKPLEK
jgi:hypothetical protein